MIESAKMILLGDQPHTLSTSSMIPEPLVLKRLGDHKSWCRYFWAREKSTFPAWYHTTISHLTFRGTCIVIHYYNKRQRDALSQVPPWPRSQTGNITSMTKTYCCVYSVQTPNDGQQTCPKHVVASSGSRNMKLQTGY